MTTPTMKDLEKIRAELKKLEALFKKHHGSPPDCENQFDRWSSVADQEKSLRARLMRACTPEEFLVLLDFFADDQISSEEYENRGSPGPWRELKKILRAEMKRRGLTIEETAPRERWPRKGV